MNKKDAVATKQKRRKQQSGISILKLNALYIFNYFCSGIDFMFVLSFMQRADGWVCANQVYT